MKSDAVPSVWRARWIGLDEPGGSPQNRWVCFSKQFDLPTTTRSLRLCLATDTKYWLWIDGVMAVLEGGLKRGPTPTGTYYDDIILPLTLTPGTHRIAILVWHFGKDGFSHNSSGRAGLLAELTFDDGTALLTDTTWRAMVHAGFGDTGAPHPAMQLAEPNIRFDAAAVPALNGWTSKSFDDSHWPAAVDLAAAGDGPWGDLVARPIPMWHDEGLHAYKDAMQFPFVSDGRPIVCPLPYNIQVTPYLEIECDASGAVIQLKTDNYFTGGGKGPPTVRCEYATRAGRQSFEAPCWMNGHAVHYEMPAGVRVLDLKYRRTRYATPMLGRFDCDDADLVTLWKKARNTLEVCMRDNYMDCPDRERGQWWGDVVIQLELAFYACDAIEAPKLARKGMMELVRWAKPDGVLYSPVPSGRPRPGVEGNQQKPGRYDSELPAQMLASIGQFGFWTYYLYSGDKEAIEAVYPAVRKYLALYRFDDRGLVVHREGGWDWFDWGDNIDKPVMLNAWYALALDGAIAMARLLDDGQPATTQHLSELEAARTRLADAFHKAFWHGGYFQGDSKLPAPDDRAQALAVVAGLAAPDTWPAIAEVLKTQEHAGPYMEKYVLEALLRMGQPDQAIGRMKSRFGEMIRSSITTLWEGWELGTAKYGGGTYNHAWSGGPLTLLQQYVAGVTPTSPAWATFVARPQLGPLRRVSTAVPTKTGVISFRLDLDANVASLDVPPGSTGAIDLTMMPGVTLDADSTALGAGVHNFRIKSR